ncbi:tRNA pseudouridine(55) synthase TruB [Candidatus Tachikawaea gelatinosa]|uniref:tRNA pseudouridine synthase B n=1 Tax=Candidatus Tachikawaea gelatinosa TaxID=1410383 RepID=A0A090ARL4_9ENTR|nr:tRNA pseudouridine(55) synthase TruB [Candidatus Tachikawaea gelatinosa]BAP58435.1 tRNA pseudouridine synthase B [Candidatus Tachikawaea gelatinosa]
MKNKKHRIINGFFILNKPRGCSSNQILQKIKNIFQAKKAGHTGSLDPIATGMLPICLGEATKFSQYLLNANKHYQVLAKLGQTTNTSDSEGIVIKERLIKFNEKYLLDVLKSFTGKILQTPSMFSAIKKNGIPLYKYARKGVTIFRQPRLINIYKLRYIFWKKEFLKLEIHCSKGTYIRTLIEDIGEKLGCGAHVIMLHRIKISSIHHEMTSFDQLQKIYSFSEKNGIDKYHLIDRLIFPIEKLLIMFPEYNLLEKFTIILKNGKIIKYKKNSSYTGFIRITEGKKKKFIGVGKINNKEEIIPIRLLNT